MVEAFGWTGKVLRVDLSRYTVSDISTMKYVPEFIGGLGVCAGIAWDEIRPGIGPFDPENLLMLMLGPLTGTTASGAGRVEVASIAPQQHPPCFSRSNMGGYWGAELKYAGFDGIVIQGRAEKPVYVWVNDGKCEILDALEIWGTGTYNTTRILRRIHGKRTRVVSCGQAGENLSRIAVIQTETENAAGQGGFGAVMGSKNLKAIAVQGTCGVKIAKPAEFLNECLKQSREGLAPCKQGSDPRWPAPEPRYGYKIRGHKCGLCSSVCHTKIWMDTPGKISPTLYTSEMFCYNYSLLRDGDETAACLESRVITSNFGINGWEVAYGIIPWLQLCKQHGLIDRIDDMEIPVPEKPIQYLRDCARYSSEFLNMLLRKIAFREGLFGDALADGACYAADVLFNGKGKPLLDHVYPRRCGQVEHWGGHWGPGGNVYWPLWLPPILQWCVDTRDPASDTTHQWTSHVQRYLTIGPIKGPYTLEKIRTVSEKVYGNPDVCDPSLEYEPFEAKAIPAIWHTDRGMVVDSLVLCDYENTKVFSMFSEDGHADTAMMSKLFSLCTGVEKSERELDRAGERVFNLLRAIDIRNSERSRKVDEETITGYMYPGKDDGVMLNRTKFLGLLEKYYELRGWNKANGWPTRGKLEELGLKDIADDLEGIGRLG